MKPILQDEYNLLTRFGLESNLDGKLFTDRNIIYAFDANGVKFKLFRIKGIQKERVVVVKYSQADTAMEFIDHVEYYEEVLKVNINEKIKNSIVAIGEFCKKNNDTKRFVVMNSTGKDSMVANMVIDRYEFKNDIVVEKLFVNTSLDCHQTYKMAKDIGLGILNPKEGFYIWIKKNMIPSRTVRKCCDVFKEGNVDEFLNASEKIAIVTGMRNDESENRKNYGFEMVNSKWDSERKSNWRLLNIIREFTEDDVWYCIAKGLIEVNPLYQMGYSRVGCVVACPYQKNYTNFLDSVFLQTYYAKWETIKREKFISDRMWVSLNCTIDEYLWDGWKKGMKYRDEPTEEVILEFCEYTGHSSENATKYFLNYCKNGCLNRKGRPQQLNATAVALNLKMASRHLGNGEMLCEKCLSEALDIKRSELKGLAVDFKKQGCTLF
ncbi:MAG: phosphoadenosine phosphosulfate reductase family protein [Cetobacterium sp.]